MKKTWGFQGDSKRSTEYPVTGRGHHAEVASYAISVAEEGRLPLKSEIPTEKWSDTTTGLRIPSFGCESWTERPVACFGVDCSFNCKNTLRHLLRPTFDTWEAWNTSLLHAEKREVGEVGNILWTQPVFIPSTTARTCAFDFWSVVKPLHILHRVVTQAPKVPWVCVALGWGGAWQLMHCGGIWCFWNISKNHQWTIKNHQKISKSYKTGWLFQNKISQIYLLSSILGSPMSVWVETRWHHWTIWSPRSTSIPWAKSCPASSERSSSRKNWSRGATGAEVSSELACECLNVPSGKLT